MRTSNCYMQQILGFVDQIGLMRLCERYGFRAGRMLDDELCVAIRIDGAFHRWQFSYTKTCLCDYSYEFSREQLKGRRTETCQLFAYSTPLRISVLGGCTMPHLQWSIHS